MNEIKLNELLNKIYYEYLDSHEAEEFIIYFKRLKQDKDNLQSKIDKAIEYIEENILNNKIEKVDWEFEECKYSDMSAKRIKPLIDILKDGK